MVQKYYAVRVGVQPGIYTNWNECKKNVIGYSGAIYKSFTTEEDAIIFMNQSPIQPNNDEESEIRWRTNGDTKVTAYLPATIGISIGKIFKCSAIVTLYLGKITSLLFFVIRI